MSGEPISRVRLTFFSEDRLLRDATGVVRSADSALAAGGWARGLQAREAAAFAARVGHGAPEGSSVVQGRVAPLPYYQGVRAMVRTFPALCAAVFRVVAGTEVVAVRLPGVVGTVAVVAATVRRRPVVVELVGDVGDVLRATFPGLRGRAAAAVATALTRWAVRRGRWVRYVTTEYLQGRHPAPRAQTSAFSDVTLGAADWQDRADDPSTPFTVVAIGSHEQLYKGHDLLIRAVAALGEEFPELRLVLLGEGVHQPTLRSLAQRLRVTDRVEFRGHVAERAEVHRVLDDAWLFAMPSRTEGLPRALVEAMARSLPAFGTEVGGIPELLDPEVLVDVDDLEAVVALVRRFVTDTKFRRDHGARNRVRAEALVRDATEQRRAWAQTLDAIALEPAAPRGVR